MNDKQIQRSPGFPGKPVPGSDVPDVVPSPQIGARKGLFGRKKAKQQKARKQKREMQGRSASRAGSGAAKGAILISAKWAGALASVFIMGAGLGMGGALWFHHEDPSRSAKGTLPELRTADDDSVAYTLPVHVSASEKARQRYAEILASEPIDVAPEPAFPAATSSAATSGAEIEAQEPLPETPTVVAAATPDVAPAQTPQPEPTEADVDGEQETPVPSVSQILPVTQQPWVKNAAAIIVDPTKPMIAVVIDDVGLDQPRSRRAIDLEGPLTVALLPYGYHLQELADKARRNGHELLVHMPMEPLDPEANPGPKALLTRLSEDELRRRIIWDLEQFKGYVGLNNHMGSRFTAYEDGMRVVIEEAQARGLLFLDSVTSRSTKGFRLAAQAGMPYAVRDVFLDHDIDAAAIAKQLVEVEKTALRHGHAIAIGHPHDETVNALRTWLPQIQAKGFQIVPITAIIRARQAAG